MITCAPVVFGGGAARNPYDPAELIEDDLEIEAGFVDNVEVVDFRVETPSDDTSEGEALSKRAVSEHLEVIFSGEELVAHLIDKDTSEDDCDAMLILGVVLCFSVSVHLGLGEKPRG